MDHISTATGYYRKGRAMSISEMNMHCEDPLSPVSKRSFSSASDSEDEQYHAQSPVSIAVQRVRKPMRKRAKTQEEKEQRQQERIMRNRAAAQVSRERKREYVATLETEKLEMVQEMNHLSNENATLRSTLSTMSERLAAMERTLSMFVPADCPLKSSISDTPVKQENQVMDLSHLGTPPGTVRPMDLLSVSSSHSQAPSVSSRSPVPEALDQRNPAAIATDPQRRSSSFPWTLSTRSPFYLQMSSILLSWVTLIRLSTSTPFANHILSTISARQTSFAMASLPSPDRVRYVATGPTVGMKPEL